MSQNANPYDDRRQTGRQVMREVLGAPYYCGFPAAIDALRAAEAFLRDKSML